MQSHVRDDASTAPSSLLKMIREISIARAVVWMEVAIAILVGISLGVGGWEPNWLNLFNVIFIIGLIALIMLGLGLFLLNRLSMGRRVAATVALALLGCAMVAYSALIYGNGDSDGPLFLLISISGTVLAILGIGLMVVREKLASRLAGYYSLWLFGILMMVFMPLHELGAINYSPRDVLVGFFGFGISLVGAVIFIMEQRMALRVEAWVTAGDAKYISGKFDDAMEYYEQALYIEPKNQKVWANSGAALLRLGMWAKALASFEKALDIDEKLAIALSGRALALTHLKRFSEALESHDRAIEADNGPASWNNKGNTLVRMGAPVKDAIECYRKALEMDENYHIAWFNKGKAELMNEDLKDALVSLTRAVELNPRFSDAWFQKGRAMAMMGSQDREALYCFDTAIELNPANAEAWMERKVLLNTMKESKARPIPLANIPVGGVVFGPAVGGQALLEQSASSFKPAELRLAADSAKLRQGALRMATLGDYATALGTLDDRLAKVPDDVVTHMTKGVLLSRIGRFDDALQSFDSAARLKPDWVGPLFSKGMMLAAKGDYDAAYREMAIVTEMRPNYADAWSVMGIILGTQKKYAEAIGCFDTTIELNPNSEDAWRSKSTALNKLGMYDEALVCYEKLAALSPTIEENNAFLQEERTKLDDAKTLFRQGVDLAKSRLYDEGLALLEDAIELRPNYVDALYISGVINGVLGRYQDAMGHFERVLELRHNHAEAMYGKANTLLKLGNYRASLEILDRVIELSPQHVDAWCDRGMILAKMGKESDAMECYDKALKMAGDHPGAIAQRERCVKAMRETAGRDGNAPAA